jgi:hypothetical protein
MVPIEESREQNRKYYKKEKKRKEGPNQDKTQTMDRGP